MTMKVAVIAEHDNHVLKSSTLNTITAALEFGGDCSLFLLGNSLSNVIEHAKKTVGVNSIIALEHERFENLLAEDVVDCLFDKASDFDVIIAPANTYGKNFMPRLASKFNVNAYSDVISIKEKDVFVRPIYAGNILQTVKSLDSKKILTVRSTAFDAAKIDEQQELDVINESVSLGEFLTKFSHSEKSISERPELTDAKIIVSGGRGLQSGEQFNLVEKLADKLGAAVGASRAAVDAGFVANELQVGQTGKVVAPQLYIALGISGAIQHLAGMKDSKVIVAINKDPEAPIFQIASYGLVGDVFELVPELIEKL